MTYCSILPPCWRWPPFLALLSYSPCSHPSALLGQLASVTFLETLLPAAGLWPSHLRPLGDHLLLNRPPLHLQASSFQSSSP